MRTNKLKIFLIASCLILGSGLSVLSVPATAKKAGEALDEKAVRELVIRTIRERPEIILEALRSLEARAEAAKSSAAKDAITKMATDIFRHKDDPIDGNPKGDITLVEFFDYQCGFCKKVHPTILRLLKEDKNIRYVYKEFPILGQGSVLAARAALAAKAMGQYAKFSNALMESKGALNAKRIFSIASSIGLDVEKLKAEMESGVEGVNKIIGRNYKLAEALNINGTPAFVIGDQVIRGAAGYNALKSAISQARLAKRAEQ
ncbi:MAG: hypothetical protein C0605_13550 [Hyphomicrobiales bacterium]|nr:MAG: hypothetical protein C0605_13550 [Hyphomicrobiales bacterium]